LLRQALQSRHHKLVETAALALAVKKDQAAFDALVKLLRETRDQGPQRRLIEALKGLGDPRAADAFLDRIERDPAGSGLGEGRLGRRGRLPRGGGGGGLGGGGGEGEGGKGGGGARGRRGFRPGDGAPKRRNPRPPLEKEAFPPP